MTYQIFKRPQAERDIEEAFVYVAEDNIDVGVYFLVAIEESIEYLADFPFIGNQRDYKNPRFQNIRMWRVKGYPNYLIFYLVTDDRIEIIRMVHSSRDLDEMFGE